MESHPGLQASPADHGNWMCLVNDNLQFNAIKKFVTILVGVEAVTGLTVGGPIPISPMNVLLLYCQIPSYNVKWKSSSGRDISKDGHLSVTEGEPVDLRFVFNRKKLQKAIVIF